MIYFKSMSRSRHLIAEIKEDTEIEQGDWNTSKYIGLEKKFCEILSLKLYTEYIYYEIFDYKM